MLHAGKAPAALLPLAMFVVVSLDPVIAGCCLPIWGHCTEQQKNRIMEACKNPYLKKDNPVRTIPAKTHAYCQLVREYQAPKTMNCIVNRFTKKEKKEYDPTLLFYFRSYCALPPSRSPPHHPRKVKVMSHPWSFSY